MNAEVISLIIKWGPLALVAVVFLWCFILGLIRGSYKVLRRLIYVILYVVLIWIFISPITNFLLDLNIPINGIKGVRNFVIHTIESNDTINDFLSYSPNLKNIIVNSPEIIVSPILFIVLVIVVLPLSFPIYWIYLIIYNLIAKIVFKRRKYEVDENGKVLRNEKGKKIKVVRKKRRLLGGFLRGAQGVTLICVVLLPVNFINRIYNKAKNAAELKNGETICDTNSLLKDYKDVCGYIDLYNETLFAKIGGEKSLDKIVSDGLTTIKYNGKEISLENELSSVAVSAVLLNDSGVLDLFLNGEFDLKTVDFNKINFDKLTLLVDYLFESSLISEITETGVSYVLHEVADDKLIELLKDDDIVSKLEYKNVGEIERELKDVIEILKLAVEKNVVDKVVDNSGDVISIVSNVNESDVETLLYKILSLKILNRAMPSAIKAYGEKHGVEVPEEMTSEINAEISGLVSQAIKFVKTMEINSIDTLKEGNLVTNIINALFVNGAIKENSKDSLATLLNNLNSSYLFKDVVSTQVNKILKDKDYKVDARVLKYVDSKDAWMKELSVLENAYVLYEEYKDDKSINYSNVTELLNEISGSKVMISVLPFAYDELLPKIGIEIDSEGLPVIDFDGENEDESKIEFYETWEKELVVLKNIADAAGVLKLQSLKDINLELIKEEEKVDALSAIMGEVYSSDLLKDSMVGFMQETINEFLLDYEIEFSKDELLSINSKDKWKNELTNINNILEIDLGEEESITGTNLNTIFNSVGNMELFKQKKIDILKVAIEKSEFLTEEEYTSILWPSSTSSQTEIDSFWNRETSVLVNVVDKKDTIEGLTSITIETLDTNEVGDLINEVMRSNILKPIVVNKVSELLVANDVKDDRDDEGNTINLKATISNVSDWKVELASIKEMVNSIDTVIETNYEEIKSQNRFNREGSEGSYTYTQNNDGVYLKKGINFYFIEAAYRYNREGSEGSYIFTQNNNGAYLKISTTNVDDVFAIIENSSLLQNSKSNLLLKAIETINITTIPSDVTVARLTQDEYALYEKERDIIIKVSKNKNAVDNLSSMSLNNINTEEIGDLLDTVTSSIIFEDYVVTQIKTVLTNNEINDDKGRVTTLENNIANVNEKSSWKIELSRIQDMLVMNGETFDDKVDGKTNITRMFETIEKSVLLKDCRASILIKIIKTVSLDGISVPSDVTSQSLAQKVGNVEYSQYILETNVLKAFAENTTVINNLGSGIGELDSGAKTYVSNLLDTMKYSKIFAVKYVSTVNSILDNIDEVTADAGYTGISVNRSDSVNKYVNVSWATEVELLSTISANIEEISAYNETNISQDTANKVSKIGLTLEALERSSFLGESSAQTIANSVIKAIKGSSASVSRGVNETWAEAFARELISL